MQTVHVRQKSGKDGVLQLSIPVGESEAEFDAVVILQPNRESNPVTLDERGWPAGYFEKTFGSIADESFVRQPQGDLPLPTELD